MEARANNIVREIEEAFADVPYPEDENISPYEPEDAEAFKRRHWRDVSVDFLMPRYKSSLGLFEPEAYRFYLPAYLIASLLHYDSVDVMPTEVIGGLTRPSPEDDARDKGRLSFSDKDIEGMRECVMSLPESERAELFPDGVDDALRGLDKEREPYDYFLPLFEERHRPLNARQCRAIAEWLAYMRDAHEDDMDGENAAWALDTYWGEFLDCPG